MSISGNASMALMLWSQREHQRRPDWAEDEKADGTSSIGCLPRSNSSRVIPQRQCVRQKEGLEGMRKWH